MRIFHFHFQNLAKFHTPKKNTGFNQSFETVVILLVEFCDVAKIHGNVLPTSWQGGGSLEGGS
jgi:hypothetical protein